MPRCSHCDYYSDWSGNVKKHESRNHERPAKSAKSSAKSYECPLCGESVSSRDDLNGHFSSVHGVVISKKNLLFDNEISFSSWKTQIEKETASLFTKHRGPAITKTKNIKINDYYCHRKGRYSSKSTGKRRLKLLGSNKINACCPARISATTDLSNGSVRVEFVETHVGHGHEVGRLRLSKEEKYEIAAEIAAGVPRKDIVTSVRNSVDVNQSNVNLVHLLTSKQVWNIQQSLNLKNEAPRLLNDSSVHSWVENQGNQLVRFYKQQGVLMESHTQLAAEDFIIVIANELQLAMLQQFGDDCVCIDGTRGLNQHDLTTIMVVDESQHGFPCAFMISNRTDAAAMEIFFTVVKQELDSPIAPQIFMSYTAEARNAWCATVSSPEHPLVCTWHVDRDLKNNLAKVEDDVSKAEVYQTLKTLLEETDKTAFSRRLESALLSFDIDPGKRDFGKYFKSEYAGSTHQWACCYRTYLADCANVHFESLHKTIENCYVKGKRVERLDKLIQVLMQSIRDKLFDLPITCHGEKISKEVSDTHEDAVKMKDVQLHETERGWSISSSTCPETFNSIVPWKKECACKVRCEDCNLCLHSYKCECLDSSVKWTICRHVHFMAITTGAFALRDQQSEPSSPQDTNSVSIIDDHRDESQDVISEEPSQKPDTSTSFQNMKNAIMEEFEAALDIARTEEDLEICRNAIRPLKTMIEAAHSTCEVNVAKWKVNFRKKPPQKNDSSVKSKRRKTEPGLRKPSTPGKVKQNKKQQSAIEECFSLSDDSHVENDPLSNIQNIV